MLRARACELLFCFSCFCRIKRSLLVAKRSLYRRQPVNNISAPIQKLMHTQQVPTARGKFLRSASVISGGSLLHVLLDPGSLGAE